MSVRSAILALSIVALTTHAGVAGPIVCGEGVFRPVVTKPVKIGDTLPGAIATFAFPFLPLLVDREDKLAKVAGGALKINVIDASGQPVKGAIVAAVHVESKRFLASASGASVTMTLPHGEYGFNAVIPGATMRHGSTLATFGPATKGPVTIRIDQEFARDAAGALPGPVGVNKEVELPWRGALPDSGRLFIERRDKGGKIEIDEMPFATKPGRLVMSAPFDPGVHTLHYTMCAPQIPLGKWSVTVLKPVVTIVAPETAVAGTMVRVKVGNPVDHVGGLVIHKKGQDSESGLQATEAAPDDFTFIAPRDAGSYVLAYGAGSSEYAHRPIQILAGAFGISAPASIAPGEKFQIAATGSPMPDDDKLEIWTTGAAARRLSTHEAKDKNLRVFGPPGKYEIRVMGGEFRDRRIVARRAITVENGTFFTSAPARVRRGEAFQIEIARPKEFFDELYIVPRGATIKKPQHDSIDTVREATRLKLAAPDKPGNYDIVYVATDVGRASPLPLARVPLTVE